jgi:hypothetical protein
MKYLKIFDNFNSNNIDTDLFLDYFQDIIDDYSLYKIYDTSFLKSGYLSITPINFQEGYYYTITNPEHYQNTTFITINILKKSSGEYPEYHSIDYKKSPLVKEFPNLYYDILKYKEIIKKIFPSDDYFLKEGFRAYLINGNKIKFYDIQIIFEIRQLKYEETEHFQTKKFLSSFNFNEDEKRKLKEIGYDMDESIKLKNFTIDDIIKCIRNKGYIYATIINNFPKNLAKEPLNPMSIDDDGLITIEFDGKEYEVELKNVEKIEF